MAKQSIKRRLGLWLKAPISCKLGTHIKSVDEIGYNYDSHMVDFWCWWCGKHIDRLPLDDSGVVSEVLDLQRLVAEDTNGALYGG